LAEAVNARATFKTPTFNGPMRILFLVHNLGKTRHFEGVIRSLTDLGHTVTLGAVRKLRKPLKLTETLADNPNLDVAPFPHARVDEWKQATRPLRLARDYMRFLQPEYSGAAKLAARAGHYAPDGLTMALERRPWLRQRWRLVQRALALAETLIPSERFFELSMRAEAPDLLLITPLVDFGSYQTDYVKAAHRIGLPVAFVPFSWDNLTNRGLIRVPPDRVLVWNERQKHEAVAMHGVPADRVTVVGAPRFDEFFAMRPATTREAFCTGQGLDPARPLLLYLCSSKFVAPDEVGFVRRWIHAIRSAADARLRDAAILVRPHPANADQWTTADLGAVEQAAVWQGQGRMQSDQSLYDSLFHSAAVVGLNTSAIIEASILERPVYTIEESEFAGGQQQTLHFHYLLAANGGPLESAPSLDTHVTQLGRGLHDPAPGILRARAFVASFVRPRGTDQPVAPLMAAEIIKAGQLRKRPRRPPLWHYPARRVLLAAMRRRG
jgi:hypothetical protein